jgi:hypothetical protein
MSPPTPAKTQIQGINGNSDATLLGTVKWCIEDDEGKTHDIILPHTYYSPTAKKKLFSPQHWAQQAGDNFPLHNGTWCAMYANKIVLHWNQQRHSHTVYLSPRSNVGVMCTAPGIRKYCNVCLTIEDEIDMQAMPTILETYTHFDRSKEQEKASEANIISDSEEEAEEMPSNEDSQPDENHSAHQVPEHAGEMQEQPSTPATLDLLF